MVNFLLGAGPGGRGGRTVSGTVEYVWRSMLFLKGREFVDAGGFVVVRSNKCTVRGLAWACACCPILWLGWTLGKGHHVHCLTSSGCWSSYHCLCRTNHRCAVRTAQAQVVAPARTWPARSPPRPHPCARP